MPHLKPRSATVVLYQGDDMDRLADLRRAVQVAERILEQRIAEQKEKSGSERLGDDDTSVTEARAALRDAQTDYDAFVDEAAERALEVELRSIGRRRFRDLLQDHPPRMVKRKVEVPRALDESEPGRVDGPEEVEHEDDEGYGVNTETFPRALLTYRDSEYVTIGEPDFPSKTAVEEFVDDELAEGDFDQLWTLALMLNRSPSRDPKATRYSLDSRSSTET